MVVGPKTPTVRAQGGVPVLQCDAQILAHHGAYQGPLLVSSCLIGNKFASFYVNNYLGNFGTKFNTRVELGQITWATGFGWSPDKGSWFNLAIQTVE